MRVQAEVMWHDSVIFFRNNKKMKDYVCVGMFTPDKVLSVKPVETG